MICPRCGSSFAFAVEWTGSRELYYCPSCTADWEQDRADDDGVNVAASSWCEVNGHRWRDIGLNIVECTLCGEHRVILNA
jgi:hypothetical protein